jgi:hypothetical protein
VAVKFFSKDSKEKEKEAKDKEFNNSDFKDATAEESTKLLADCRLLRKDELVVSFIFLLNIEKNVCSKKLIHLIFIGNKIIYEFPSSRLFSTYPKTC